MGFFNIVRTKVSEEIKERREESAHKSAANKIIRRKARAEYLRAKEIAALADAKKRGSQAYKVKAGKKEGWDFAGGISRLANTIQPKKGKSNKGFDILKDFKI